MQAMYVCTIYMYNPLVMQYVAVLEQWSDISHFRPNLICLFGFGQTKCQNRKLVFTSKVLNT